MARILTIFGRNRSSRRNLSFKKSNEWKVIEWIESIDWIGRSIDRIDRWPPCLPSNEDKSTIWGLGFVRSWNRRMATPSFCKGGVDSRWGKMLIFVNLRVLGSPNPGQSFGRGLSGPQATEVSRDPGGSGAATNLTVHSSNSFLGPSFWQGAPGFYSWVAFFDVFRFFAFSNQRKVRGSGRLVADPIMEDTVVKQLFFSSRRYGCFSLHSVRCDACAICLNIAFFHVFLVPDQRYSDSAAGTLWTANRFTKTRTFQNFSKRGTWKTHAESQHTAEFGKKTARIRGRLVHKSWSFEKLCQVREIVPNRNKTLRFFA